MRKNNINNEFVVFEGYIQFIEVQVIIDSFGKFFDSNNNTSISYLTNLGEKLGYIRCC
jgi:hypothetical protein